MKRHTYIITAATAAALLLTAGIAYTQSAPTPRIGFVNPIALLDKAPQTKAAKERVEAEFKDRDDALVAKQKDLREQEERLKRDGSTMSADARQKLESEIVKARREIKRDLDEFREDFSVARNREMAGLQKHINEAIVKLAKDEKFDLIVGDSVVFASERIDITDKVLEILSAEYEKSGG